MVALKVPTPRDKLMPDFALPTAPPATNGRARVLEAISHAAARSDVDFNYLLNQAKIESGLKPDAHARTSSAAGLFQFTHQTWLGILKAHGAENNLAWVSRAIIKAADGRYSISDPSLQSTIMGLREQPEAAASMAAASAADNRDYLFMRTGAPATSVTLYLAHFLGPAAASKFVTAHSANPDQAAAPLFPAAASTNRTVFYSSNGAPRSLAEIYDRFSNKLNMPSDANEVEYSGSGETDPSSAIFMPTTPSTFVPAAIFPSSVASKTTSQSSPITPSTSTLSTISIRLGMFEIEPMPRHLSLSYAQRTYERLSTLDAGNG
jgi:hypothetical protein